MIPRRRTLMLPLTAMLAPARASAQPDSALAIIAADDSPDALAIAARFAAVAGPDGPRVQAIPGAGVSQTVARLAERGAPAAAILPADVLATLQAAGVLPHPGQSLHYVARLYFADVHVAASRRIPTLRALAGRPVSLGSAGGPAQIVGSLLFERAGIPVAPVFLAPDAGLRALLGGEIDGLVAVAPKPSRLFFSLNLSDGVHFLPVTVPPDRFDGAAPSRIDPADYPMLGGGEAGGGVPTPTLAVAMVLAVFDWPPGSAPYDAIARYTASLFQYTPRPYGFDPAADVPDWTRFSAAALRLGRIQPVPDRPPRQRPSARGGGQAGGALSQQDRDRLFEEFLRWRQGR